VLIALPALVGLVRTLLEGEQSPNVGPVSFPFIASVFVYWKQSRCWNKLGKLDSEEEVWILMEASSSVDVTESLDDGTGTVVANLRKLAWDP